MRKFDEEVAKWDKERLAVFLEYRHGLLTQAPGNIVTKTTDNRIIENAPFSQGRYQHQDRMGRLSSAHWLPILSADPLRLVSPNPFTLSEFRTRDKEGEYAFKIWDSAVAIPASASRKSKVLKMSATPMLRNINDYWREEAMLAMQRVGPLGTGGTVLRPASEWIFDLTKMDDGWILLEAAHVLAHMRGDTKTDRRRFGFLDSKTSGHWRAELGKIIVALAYDLPIDTNPQDDGMPGAPDFPSCRTEFKTSSYFDTPYGRCPWNNREALRFDDTLSVMTAGVLIEPHPYGFNTGTLDWHAHDKWACAPTMVAIAGWETVDVITHQPLVSTYPDDRKVPICYGIHPLDMMPADLFWAYLALCKDAGMYKEPEQLNAECGKPNRYRYVYDWLNSREFEEALLHTPSLPCKDCARPNKKTEGAPRRPYGFQPKKKPTGNYGADALLWQEWLTYNADMAAIRGIIQRAVEPFEAQLHGGRLISNRLRAARKTGHNAVVAQLDVDHRIAKILEKKRTRKSLTARESQVYKQYLETTKGKSQ